jgi:hypothetical protein
MRSWRPLTWVIIVVQLLFTWWLIASMGSVADNVETCPEVAVDTLSSCEAGNAGTAIGGTMVFFMIIFLWALIDIILGVIWMVTNKARKAKAPKGMYAVSCARCGVGQNLPKGQAEFTCWQCKAFQHVGGWVQS